MVPAHLATANITANCEKLVVRDQPSLTELTYLFFPSSLRRGCDSSFDAFSHKRSSASMPPFLDVLLAARYPPYSSELSAH